MGDEKRRQQLPNFADQEDDDIEETKTALRANADKPPASKVSRPFLIVLAGTSVGEMFLIKESESIVGRARVATIRIDDEGISRKHAKMTCVGTDVHVEDMGSANGTFVNDAKVTTRRLLKDGDKLTLGSTTILKFTYTDDVEETFQRRMFQAALRDGMTKAYNKKYLLERLDKELAFSLRHNTPLSLLMLDVDHFKKVNDQYGHPAGDAVLVRLADIVEDTIRKEDVFARYGGEEFTVLCRGVEVEKARILGERLRTRIAQAVIKHEGREITATISVGVAGFPELAVDNVEDLLRAADEALYEAKRAGRDRVSVKTRL